MARAPNKKVDEAYELYKKGYKLVDIAKELDMAESTIRVWKNRYKWGGENETFQKNKRNVSNKKGNKKSSGNNGLNDGDNNNKTSSKTNSQNPKARYGNKNAVGNEVKEVLENTELTDKQKLFCIYYIEDFNKTRAYQKAYACSYDTARVEGCKCLTKPNIKKQIDMLLSAIYDKEYLKNNIFQKYIDIAFSDITDYIEFGQEEVKGRSGTHTRNYVHLKNSLDVDGTIIKEIKQSKCGIRIKLQDKMKALQWLSERMDLLPKDETEKPDREYAILRNEKLKIETDKLKGNKDVAPIKIEFVKASEKNEQIQDDGFIEALNVVAKKVWSDEDDT